MPGPSRDRGEKLIAAVKAGTVTAEKVRERAANVLRLMVRTGAISDTRVWQERADDRPEHRALIRRAGAEGAVLVKNDGILPLAAGKVAVIGPNAKVAQIMGGGSAQLNPHYMVSPWDGLMARGLDLTYAQGCTNHRMEPVMKGKLKVDFFANTTLTGSPVYSEDMDEAQVLWLENTAKGLVDHRAFSVRVTGTIETAAGLHRVGAVSVGYLRVHVDGRLVANAWEGWTRGQTFFEEGCNEVVGEVDLAAGTHEVMFEYRSKPSANLGFSALRVGIGRTMGDAEIAEAVKVARAADQVVLCVGRTGEWDTEGWDLPTITLPGRQDELIAAVAAVNPNTVVVLQTGGPVEMPWLADVKAVLQAWYPGQETGNAIADMLYGDVEPGGRLAQTQPKRWTDNPTHSQDKEIYPGMNGHVRYEEGLFIGYRHYDKHGIEPLFPFGFGLGYTTFAMGAMTVAADGSKVSVPVTNTGARAGATVVQVYVGDVQARVVRPVKELKGFAKVTLKPGETRLVEIALDARAFAFFDKGAWHVEAGEFVISAGFSAADLPAVAKVSRGAEVLPL